MKIQCSRQFVPKCQRGFTLAEVSVSMGILGLVFGGVISGYVQTLHRAEWAGYNLAANSLAQQRMEQARAAKWDTLAFPEVDRLVTTNFAPTVEILDVPITGDHVIHATNFTTISAVSTTPPLKAIQVDCVWAYHTGEVYTNRVVTYRAPDQ